MYSVAISTTGSVDYSHEADLRNHSICKLCDINEFLEVHPNSNSLLHLNILSSPVNLQEFQIITESLGKPTFMGLSETWLTPHNENIYAPLYITIYAKSGDSWANSQLII